MWEQCGQFLNPVFTVSFSPHWGHQAAKHPSSHVDRQTGRQTEGQKAVGRSQEASCCIRFAGILSSGALAVATSVGKLVAALNCILVSQLGLLSFCAHAAFPICPSSHRKKAAGPVYAVISLLLSFSHYLSLLLSIYRINYPVCSSC